MRVLYDEGFASGGVVSFGRGGGAGGGVVEDESDEEKEVVSFILFILFLFVNDLGSGLGVVWGREFGAG